MKINFESLFSSIGTIGESLSTLNAERERVQAERDAIAALPLARQTLISELNTFIDSHRTKYLSTLQEIVSPLSKRADRPITAATSTPGNLLTRDGQVSAPALLLGLLGEQVKTALRAAIEGMPLSDADGVTREERAERLSQLDRRIEELNGEISDIRARLARAGIDREPVLPTLSQIQAAFFGGTPTGQNYDKGVKELFLRLNPGLGERADDSKRPD